MSGAHPNLNRSPGEEFAAPERFDLNKHVYEAKPFVTGARMLLTVSLTAMVLAVSLLGGAYLTVGGQVPDLAAWLKGAQAAGSPEQVTSQQNKGTEEEFKRLLEEYASTYNAGWGKSRPEHVFASGFFSEADSDASKGAVLPALGDTTRKIGEVRLDGFLVESPSVAYADATILLTRVMTSSKWWVAEKGAGPASGELVVTQPVRYSFRLRRTGYGWRLERETWLAKGPAIIRDVEDQGELPPQPLPELYSFPHQRPPAQEAQAFLQTLCGSYAAGEFPEGLYFSDYALILADRTELNQEQAKARLLRFRAKVENCTITPKLLGFAQVDGYDALALVSYRIQFTPRNSLAGNSYTAAWTERVRFNIGKLRNGWRVHEVERLSTSPILDFYGF